MPSSQTKAPALLSNGQIFQQIDERPSEGETPHIKNSTTEGRKRAQQQARDYWRAVYGDAELVSRGGVSWL